MSILKAASRYFWPAIGVMLFVIFLTDIIDRFSGNDTIGTFYSATADATCIVHRERGKDTMSCLPGDHRTGGGK